LPGPKPVLAYLSRYAHRVAIANRRLIAADETNVTFRWKDYRLQGGSRYKAVTLSVHEFIPRFAKAFPSRRSLPAVRQHFTV
jgi:hypothetical protein